MEGEIRRIIIAIGYRGEEFHGAQYQPNVPTVQAVLEEALRDLKWCDEEVAHPVRFASRTDAGVHVRMNLVSFDVAENLWQRVGPKRVLRALNDRLPESLVVWAAQPVTTAVRVRNVQCREYLYRLQPLKRWPIDIPAERLNRWCRLFEGGHDLTNFCRVEPDRSTLRTILECSPWLDSEGRVLGFRIIAESFLWNQVRRIAAALHGLATRKIQTAEVLKGLHRPAEKADFGLAPAEWLVLWSIEHSDIKIGSELLEPSSISWSSPPGVDDNRLHASWQSVARNEIALMMHRDWISAMTPKSAEK